MLKFPEMPYARPDIEAAKQFLADAAARLDAAESFEAADAVFVEVDRRSAELDTHVHPLPHPPRHQHRGQVL